MDCRDEMFRRSLGQLKQDIVKANALVQEANFLAEETGRMTKFSVTLQIPPANLGPNRKVSKHLISQLIGHFWNHFEISTICPITIFSERCFRQRTSNFS